MGGMGDGMIDVVKRALGRSGGRGGPPTPPEIGDPVARLVHFDIGLAELFAARAKENGMGVTLVRAEEVLEGVIGFLRGQGCRRVAVCGSGFLDRLGVFDALKVEGFEVRRSSELKLDEMYEIDCGITDVYCAVAEVGGMVMRASAEHGRAVSLIPPVHVAIIEPAKVVGDLIDLFEKLGKAAAASATTIITGPSKTADIEMNIVTGVHGPGVVQAFILQ